MSYIWDQRFLKLAHEVGSWSKDTRWHVGSVIIGKHRKPVSFGYNGPPRGVDDNVAERYEQPLKSYFFEHAERNAIYNSDNDLEGCTIYVTHYPCPDCARAMIQNQITRVVVDAANGYDSPWGRRKPEIFKASKEMLDEVESITVEEIALNTNTNI